MQAGSLVAGRYELVAELEPGSPVDQWTAHDRHLGRHVVVVFGEGEPDAGRGRLLDGGVEGDRRFLVFEQRASMLDDTVAVPAASPDPTMVVPIAAPVTDATAVVSLPPPGPGAPSAPGGPARRRPRPLARAGALTLASFGMGAAAVLAYGVMTAPDPRFSGAGAGADTVEARDPAADARPTRTLPGVVSTTTVAPTTTAVPTTTTTVAPTTTAKPTTTTTPKKVTRPEPKPTTTTTERRRGRGRSND